MFRVFVNSFGLNMVPHHPSNSRDHCHKFWPPVVLFMEVVMFFIYGHDAGFLKKKKAYNKSFKGNWEVRLTGPKGVIKDWKQKQLRAWLIS